MKTKTKKPVRKKPGTRKAGDVFGRMLEKSELFEYMVLCPEDKSEEHWERWLHVQDMISVQDGGVRVWDVFSCDDDHPVVVKGDTVEITPPHGSTCLFRFYTAPRRIKNLKDLVK